MTMRPSYPKHDKSPPLTLKLTGRSPFDGLIVTLGRYPADKMELAESDMHRYAL